MILYFSGCGNSRWVANTLAERLQEHTLFIPNAPETLDLQPDEALGFVFPVYAWAPPQLVLDYIQRMRLRTTPTYVWFVCTCGDESGLTRRIFYQTLKQVGLSLDACFCLKMPETYIAFPGFKLDSADKEKRKIDTAAARLPHIATAIAQRERGHDEMIPGALPWVKSYLLRALFYRLLISDRRFHVEAGCTGCGLCARTCPLHNISMVDDHPHWNGHCTQCMSCYHHCPVNAIHYGKVTHGKGQYYFSHPSRPA